MSSGEWRGRGLETKREDERTKRRRARGAGGAEWAWRGGAGMA